MCVSTYYGKITSSIIGANTHAEMKVNIVIYTLLVLITFPSSSISACVLAPIMEEVIFRGFFLQRMAHKWGIKKAVIISSIPLSSPPKNCILVAIKLFRACTAIFVHIFFVFMYFYT
jgi:membrane protease YdiL (CAAX protease family)